MVLALEHCNILLDVDGLQIFKAYYSLCFFQIPHKIAQLFFVVPDGSWCQISYLAVEDKFFGQGFDEHKNTSFCISNPIQKEV